MRPKEDEQFNWSQEKKFLDTVYRVVGEHEFSVRGLYLSLSKRGCSSSMLPDEGVAHYMLRTDPRFAYKKVRGTFIRIPEKQLTGLRRDG